MITFEQLPQEVGQIRKDLNALKSLLSQPPKEAVKPEIIDTKEICARLDLSEPTIVRWREKGKIPCLRIGTNIRYDWAKVLEAIESSQKRK